jgi:hypothetical protein
MFANNEINKRMGDALTKAGLPQSYLMGLGSEVAQLQMGGQVEVGRLREMRKALRAMDSVMKAGDLGTLAQGQAFSGGASPQGELAPFVPQSLSKQVTLVGQTKEEVWLSNMLGKIDVGSTLHEDVIIDKVGNPHTPRYISEGGGGSVQTMASRRRVVTIKQMCERRQVSYLSTIVNMLGLSAPMVQKGQLNLQTEVGMESLITWRENELFNGDSDLLSSSIAMDGLYKQMTGHSFTAGLPSVSPTYANYEDKRGQAVTGSEMVGWLGNMAGGPFFAGPSHCAMHPGLFGAISEAGSDLIRFNGGAGNSGGFNFGSGKIWLNGARSKCELASAPLITGAEDRVSYTAADGAAPPSIVGFTMTVGGGQVAAANHASSKFISTDAGEYMYRLIPVGNKGMGTPLQVPTDAAAVTVATDDAVTIDVPDAAIHGSGDNQVEFYIVERTTMNGAIATSKIMWRYPVNTDGAGGGTRIIDANLHIPGTSPAYFLSFDQRFIHWLELLPMFRYPLPAVETMLPFLILWFGYLNLKSPIKMSMWDNCKRSL